MSDMQDMICFFRPAGSANAATVPAARSATPSAGHGGSQARVARHVPRPSAHAHGPRHVPRPSFGQDGEDDGEWIDFSGDPFGTAKSARPILTS